MTTPKPLAGRTALVLGVERPAARAAAVALAEAGAAVAAVTISEDTQAEFAANSTANEFWAIGVRGIALTSDGGESTVREAIAAAAAALGPVSILVCHPREPLPRAALAGLRSDPALVVLVGADATPAQARALLAWTRELADSGLRANALAASRSAIDGVDDSLAEHRPSALLALGAAAVYLASDATAAVDGAVVVAAEG